MWPKSAIFVVAARKCDAAPENCDEIGFLCEKSDFFWKVKLHFRS